MDVISFPLVYWSLFPCCAKFCPDFLNKFTLSQLMLFILHEQFKKLKFGQFAECICFGVTIFPGNQDS